MIEISLPRISRISRSDRLSNSRPLNPIAPVGREAVGYGKSFRIDTALTDLPDPDSPTSATHSPRLISNEMRSTASEDPLGWWNATDRSRTSSSGWVTASIIASSPERLARIECVADGFTDEDQQRQHDGNRKKAG